MLFKLFKIYYAFYHQHQKGLNLYKHIPQKESLEIVESCKDVKIKLENLIVYLFVKHG